MKKPTFEENYVLSERNSERYVEVLWKLYDESFLFKLKMWSLMVCACVLAVGVPLSLGYTIWERTHNPQSPSAQQPDLFSDVMIGLMWLSMFVWPTIKERVRKRIYVLSQSEEFPREAESALIVCLPIEERADTIEKVREQFERLRSERGIVSAILYLLWDVARVGWKWITGVFACFMLFTKWPLIAPFVESLFRHIGINP